MSQPVAGPDVNTRLAPGSHAETVMWQKAFAVCFGLSAPRSSSIISKTFIDWQKRCMLTRAYYCVQRWVIQWKNNNDYDPHFETTLLISKPKPYSFMYRKWLPTYWGDRIFLSLSKYLSKILPWEIQTISNLDLQIMQIVLLLIYSVNNVTEWMTFEWMRQGPTVWSGIWW